MSLVLCTIHSPEQKTKSAKSGLNTVFKPLLTIPPSATSCTHRLTCRFGRCFCTLCRGLHRRPAPFAKEAKRFIYFIRRALATLSTVYNPDTIKCRGYLFYLVLTLLTFDQEEYTFLPFTIL